MLDREWLTVEEISELLGVNPETVRRWIRAGDIPVLDIGGPRTGYRIARDDLERFMQDRYGRLRLPDSS